MLLNCGVGEDSWESLGLQGDHINPSQRKSVLNSHWKDWCWSWNSNTLATWCEELTHLKRPWWCERLKEGGERDDRGWDGWMASRTQWTCVWVNSGSWDGQGGLMCCSPRDSQESSPTPQFKSINSLVLSSLYSPTHIHTGKTIALTTWNFVGKAMSALFNMLCSLVITFLPRSKDLLISWLQSPSTVILEPPK